MATMAGGIAPAIDCCTEISPLIRHCVVHQLTDALPHILGNGAQGNGPGRFFMALVSANDDPDDRGHVGRYDHINGRAIAQFGVWLG